MEYFIPESIMPNIVKCFFDIKNSSYYMFSSVEAFHDGLGQSKQVDLSLSLSLDLSLVDLALLKPDTYLRILYFQDEISASVQ